MGRRNLSSSSTHSLYESKISLEVMSILFLLAFRCDVSMQLLLILVSQKSLHQNMCFMRN